MTNWKELRKELNFTEEEEEEIRLEKQLILATIEAREKRKMSQRKLSELSG